MNVVHLYHMQKTDDIFLCGYVWHKGCLWANYNDMSAIFPSRPEDPIYCPDCTEVLPIYILGLDL